jgi:hypothetical protein
MTGAFKVPVIYATIEPDDLKTYPKFQEEFAF